MSKRDIARYGEFVARAVEESAGQRRPGFEGASQVAMQCEELWSIAGALGRLAVKQCSDESYSNKDEMRARRLSERAAELCARMGFDVLCNAGDPRGAAVVVLMPSGISNDWGRRGWALTP